MDIYFHDLMAFFHVVLFVYAIGGDIAVYYIGNYITKDELPIEERLRDSGLIRNRLKLYAIRKNAQAVLNLYERGYTLNAFLWNFVDGRPVDNHFRAQSEVPANTTQSDAMSRALKRSGFCFVGTTICYALMQATGLVNDHLVSCYRHDRQTIH